jgi:hypothetical protein
MFISEPINPWSDANQKAVTAVMAIASVIQRNTLAIKVFATAPAAGWDDVPVVKNP